MTAYLRPEPRVRMGLLVSRNRAASACMDLSDGLADAAHQIADASGVGVTIDAAALPIDPAARAFFEARGLTPVAEALTGGDDYELLLAVRPRAQRRLAAAARHGERAADARRPLHRRPRRHAAARRERRAAAAAGLQPLSMIHLTRGSSAAGWTRFFTSRTRRERTAAAFALGVFFGFSPFLGLHTVLGIVFAFLLNLNRVAVLLGVYSNLPWIIAPYYAFATMAGAMHHAHRVPEGFRAQLAALFELSALDGEFWHRLITILKPLLWPYTVGSTIGALVLAAIAYPLALGVRDKSPPHS